MRGGWLLCGLLLAGCGSARDDAPPANQDTARPSPASASAASQAPAPAEKGPSASALDLLIHPRQPGRFAPRDDCGGLPGARAFRERLLAAAEAGDAAAIADLAVDDVKLDFGGGSGRKALIAKLKADDGALLAELRAVLRLGCAGSDGGGLVIPWYFAQDLGDVDTYAAMLVTSTDIPLYSRPDKGSAAKQRLSWHMVTLIDGLRPNTAFQHVRTGDGATGYVVTANLRSPLDYRLLAVRQGDQWKMTALIAGD